MKEFGRWFIGLGAGLVLLGLALYFFGERLGWLGRLPGDLRWGKGNVRFYFPITTLIIINLIIYLILRLYTWLK
ncbi:MAG: DUF2905 domain-containing protein [Fidelibacterota bacterium]